MDEIDFCSRSSCIAFSKNDQTGNKSSSNHLSDEVCLHKTNNNKNNNILDG